MQGNSDEDVVAQYADLAVPPHPPDEEVGGTGGRQSTSAWPGSKADRAVRDAASPRTHGDVSPSTPGGMHRTCTAGQPGSWPGEPWPPTRGSGTYARGRRSDGRPGSISSRYIPGLMNQTEKAGRRAWAEEARGCRFRCGAPFPGHRAGTSSRGDVNDGLLQGVDDLLPRTCQLGLGTVHGANCPGLEVLR